MEGTEEGGGQVKVSQSVLVAISAKQDKVITSELLDGMTQNAVSASYPLKSMTTMTSTTSSTSTVRRYFATVDGMGDQETQVEGRVIASSAIMEVIGRVSWRGLSAWPQGTRRPQGTTIPVALSLKGKYIDFSKISKLSAREVQGGVPGGGGEELPHILLGRQ